MAIDTAAGARLLRHASAYAAGVDGTIAFAPHILEDRPSLRRQRGATALVRLPANRPSSRALLGGDARAPDPLPASVAGHRRGLPAPPGEPTNISVLQALRRWAVLGSNQ